MFERRLKATLSLLAFALAIIVGRLVHLQIVRAEFYRDRTSQMMLREPIVLPFVRGRVLDRTGEILVSDEPCWDLCVDYGVIVLNATAWLDAVPTNSVGNDPWIRLRTMRSRRIAAAVKRWRRRNRYPSAETLEVDKRREFVKKAYLLEINQMWQDISRFASLPGADLTERLLAPGSIFERVDKIRRSVASRRGFDAAVREETWAHPILTGLSADRQIAARETLATRYPWVVVKPSSRRAATGEAEPFAHLLGRLGRVMAAHVDKDPNREDPFSLASYKPDERAGIAGIEFLAERSLRGRRGRILKDRSGRTVGKVIPAQNGRDVSLTIHAELQRRLFDLLGDSVRQISDAPGGAIVVLDIATREVLALVSYPSYDPAAIGDAEAYGRLRDDTEALPLQFRAVANRYAPGSIVKPLVCWAGLVNNEISLDSVEHCTGYLFDDVRKRWRCWRISGTTMRKAHGDIKVVDALRGSCNVFMYRLGEKLGVERLCGMFDMAGIGRPSGIGLREEIFGINPTPGWLMTKLGRSTTTAHSRLFAIGQGELALTPLQAANLMAVYASGRYRPVTLLRGGSPTPEWTLPGNRDQLAAIRLGIYQVVNDIDGTAHKYSYFDNDLYALCGKTGSATTGRRPTAYDVPYVDKLGHGDVARIPATAKEPAIKRFISDHPDATFDRSEVVVASYWPRYELPPGERYSHAWFGGFLQRKDASGQPDWAVPPRVSFAVLVEFGGSGGRTAGPIARKVAALLLEVLGPDLDPDGTGPRGAGSNIARGYANPSSARVSTDAPRDGTLSNLNAETPGDTDP